MTKKVINNGSVQVTTFVYQARNGALFLDWGNTVIKLEKDYADNIAYDIPDFDVDQYNKFYGKK
jgi:urocanate hydratase